ncbi:hypothetical protein Tco_0901949, partial [Tanacetum coccineum]
LDDQLEACVKLDSIITVTDAKNLHFQLKKHEDSSTFLEAFLQIAFAVSESDDDIIVTLNMCTAGLLCKKLLSDGGNVVVNSITEVINNASRALSAVFTDPDVLDCPILSPGEGTDATMSDDEEDQVESDANLYDGSLNGHDSMGFGPLVPTESEMSLIERVRQELKHELKQVRLRPS